MDRIFEAIVDANLFNAAGAIIAARSHVLSDDEMLDRLKEVLEETATSQALTTAVDRLGQGVRLTAFRIFCTSDAHVFVVDIVYCTLPSTKFVKATITAKAKPRSNIFSMTMLLSFSLGLLDKGCFYAPSIIRTVSPTKVTTSCENLANMMVMARLRPSIRMASIGMVQAPWSIWFVYNHDSKRDLAEQFGVKNAW